MKLIAIKILGLGSNEEFRKLCRCIGIETEEAEVALRMATDGPGPAIIPIEPIDADDPFANDLSDSLNKRHIIHNLVTSNSDMRFTGNMISRRLLQGYIEMYPSAQQGNAPEPASPAR